jgi:hypothetical protein
VKNPDGDYWNGKRDQAIADLTAKVNDLGKKVDVLIKTVSSLQAKSSIWGGLAGLLGGGIAILSAYLLRKAP